MALSSWFAEESHEGAGRVPQEVPVAPADMPRLGPGLVLEAAALFYCECLIYQHREQKRMVLFVRGPCAIGTHESVTFLHVSCRHPFALRGAGSLPLLHTIVWSLKERVSGWRSRGD